MMKRMMMLFVMVASVMLILLLFVDEKEDFHIMYSKSSYSMMKSSDGETFQIELFASHNESFYLDESYLVRASIKDEETLEQVSFEIENIDVSDTETNIKGKTYYYVSFQCMLSLDMLSYELAYDHAVVELYYENGEILSFDMGEFYYIEKANTSSINILEMVATHEEYHGLTVSGLYLELGHTNTKKITLKNVFLGTSEALVNPFYTKEMYDSVSYDDALEDILYPNTFDYLKKNDGMLDYDLLPRQTRAFYFPFTYIHKRYLLHRFYVKIEYMIDGQLKQEVIDDFPFIKQSIFEVREEDFDVYYPRMHGE